MKQFQTMEKVTLNLPFSGLGVFHKREKELILTREPLMLRRRATWIVACFGLAACVSWRTITVK